MFNQAIDAVIHPSPHSQRSAAVLALAGLFTFGCIAAIEPLPKATGTIMITVSTAGDRIDLDADGYMLSIDSQPGQTVDVNALVTLGSLAWGEHVVRLDGLSPNCYITGGNDRSFDLVNSTSASPVAISLSVLCVGDGSGKRDTTGTGNWDW